MKTPLHARSALAPSPVERARRAPGLAAALALATGCAGTGQPEASYDAYAVAAPPGEIAAGAWTIALDEALVALGPVYFCASASGSATLCDTAVAEMTAIARIDALDPEPQRLGRVRGFEGEIRSASFDYGIHWFATESAPSAAPAAPGGHSARFRGRATRGGDTLEFTAEVDVVPQYQGQRAVPTVAAAGVASSATARLDIRLDVGAWLARVDFDALAAEGGRAVRIAPGGAAHNALAIAMVAQHPPEFMWLVGDDSP